MTSIQELRTLKELEEIVPVGKIKLTFHETGYLIHFSGSYRIPIFLVFALCDTHGSNTTKAILDFFSGYSNVEIDISYLTRYHNGMIHQIVIDYHLDSE